MIERPAINTKGEAIPGGKIIEDIPEANNEQSVRQLSILKNSLPSSKKEFVQRAIDNKPQEKRHPIADFIDNLLEDITPEEP